MLMPSKPGRSARVAAGSVADDEQAASTRAAAAATRRMEFMGEAPELGG
ncbi:MAG: hypothetical protein AVDCRST_MAG89-4617 [uncultured Gemmatimonadetes bacterium]|uniref:Uncharacterized protein n=1 Tax=uncultured Gemmatimonadota bacterium TaxID=203437 RepID=A0A6J4N003_9BACT|nr:MAG: hypothetical protein AVDCRST_MAG89-4617 [uncultured Gemmatimonadota bacterium]